MKPVWNFLKTGMKVLSRAAAVIILNFTRSEQVHPQVAAQGENIWLNTYTNERLDRRANLVDKVYSEGAPIYPLI